MGNLDKKAKNQKSLGVTAFVIETSKMLDSLGKRSDKAGEESRRRSHDTTSESAMGKGFKSRTGKWTSKLDENKKPKRGK